MQRKANRKEVYSEKDWSDPAASAAYEKSKLLAETAAWDFLSKLPEDEKKADL